jgi:hypothetical protein
LRLIRLAVVALIATAFIGTAAASHVSPTVRDVDMANLPNGEAETSIVVDPSDANHVAAGANERPGKQHWYVSTDGGRNWSDGALPSGTLTVLGESNTTMSDPSLDFGSTGEIYYSALMHFGPADQTCTLFVTTSEDDGANWSDPADGVVAAAVAPLDCHDKEMIAVDRAHNDNVYVAWNPYTTTTTGQVAFSRDLNGTSDGLSFSALTILSDGICRSVGPDLAVAGNALYVAWATYCPNLFGDGDPGTVYVTKSTNQGGSWSTPVAAATLSNVAPMGIDPGFRSRSFPSIDVDPATGRVFVAYNSYATAPTTDPDIYVASSPDGTSGSWTAPIRVNQDGGTTEQVMPWVSVGNGRVHVAYYSRAIDGTSWNLNVAYGAATASPSFTEIKVSSESTPPTAGFLGDYTGNFAGADDVLHPAWTDGRSGVGGATDAFTARVDFSPPTAFTLAPLAPSRQVGTFADFTVTVTGAHGEPEQFIPVKFAVTSSGFPGPKKNSSVVTGPAGTAGFSYTNSLPGTDTLRVFADLDEDGVEDSGETLETTVTWLPPPSTNGARVTGAGTIPLIAGGEASFSLSVQKKASDLVPKGNVSYSAPGLAVASTAITAVVVAGGDATIFGTATVNGGGSVVFRVDALDGGEPSADDRFEIRLTGGYDSTFRPLTSGNIQVR